MKVWAIRDKNTKLYIPDSRSYKSHEEATSSDRPRIYFSKRSVQNSLTAWLRGKWNQSTSGGYTYFGEPDYEIITEPVKDESRKRENMEIVEFSLVELVS